MLYYTQKASILACLLAIAMNAYAGGEGSSVNVVTPSVEISSLSNNDLDAKSPTINIKKTEKYVGFSDWINEKSYTVKIDEKETLREEWRQTLGTDIFYPYFKAEEIKTGIEQKSKVKVLKLKGKAKFKENEAKYIFNLQF